MNLSKIAFLEIKNANYPYLITRISKYEAIDLLQNIGFNGKKVKHKYQEQFWCYKYTRSSNLNKRKKRNIIN